MSSIFKDPVQAGSLNLQDSNFITDLLEGWDDTPAIDTAIVAAGGSDGVYMAGQWLSKEKYLTIGGAGHAYGGGRLGAEALKRQLKAAFRPGEEVVLTRTIDGHGFSMFVRLYDIIKIDQPVDEGFRYTIPVMSLDGMTYGSIPSVATGGAYSGTTWYRTYTSEARTYGASEERSYVELGDTMAYPEVATILNEGDSVSKRVTMTISGPLSSGDWYIINITSGEIFFLDITVNPGDQLVVNTIDESVTINGVDISHLMYGEWMTAAPGYNTYKLVAGSATNESYAIISVLSAWS